MTSKELEAALTKIRQLKASMTTEEWARYMRPKELALRMAEANRKKKEERKRREEESSNGKE